VSAATLTLDFSLCYNLYVLQHPPESNPRLNWLLWSPPKPKCKALEVVWTRWNAA